MRHRLPAAPSRPEDEPREVKEQHVIIMNNSTNNNQVRNKHHNTFHNLLRRHDVKSENQPIPGKSEISGPWKLVSFQGYAGRFSTNREERAGFVAAQMVPEEKNTDARTPFVLRLTDCSSFADHAGGPQPLGNAVAGARKLSVSRKSASCEFQSSAAQTALQETTQQETVVACDMV